jgi:hypothetical protein
MSLNYYEFDSKIPFVIKKFQLWLLLNASNEKHQKNWENYECVLMWILKLHLCIYVSDVNMVEKINLEEYWQQQRNNDGEKFNWVVIDRQREKRARVNF